MEPSMTRLISLPVRLLGLAAITACAASPDAPLAESAAVSAVAAYTPMGFARVTAAGALLTGFGSGGAISIGHGAVGSYLVTFAGLGALSGDSQGGDVQVTTEGAGNVRCRTSSWFGAPNLAVNVLCAQPNGTPADAPFAVQFFRNAMPVANNFPTTAAYVWSTAGGAVDPFYDYNSSGHHNTITKVATGTYQVQIPNMSGANGGVMLTPYAGAGAGAACGVVWWAAGPLPGNGVINVTCRDVNNVLVDSAFSLSFAVTGPSMDQQGAHAWFNGTSAPPAYASAVGKILTCSVATVTGTRVGSLVTITVAGDLGSWDGGAFLRASFSSAYGAAGYCKVESLTASGLAPSSTATTTLRCYDPTGAVVAAPLLTFTHVTSDEAGPC
jgi:hypothetical protein